MTNQQFELVLSVWEDGLFSYRLICKADNIDDAIRDLLEDVERVKAQIAIQRAAIIDDDIPF